MVPKDGVGKGIDLASMKALPKRKGNRAGRVLIRRRAVASMKALPKRKGNAPVMSAATKKPVGLNESPSKKEGK